MYKIVVFFCVELVVYFNYFKNEDEIMKNGEKLNKDYCYRIWLFKIVKIVYDNCNYCKLEQSVLIFVRIILCFYCLLKFFNENL